MKIITDTGSDILETEAKAMGVDLVPISEYRREFQSIL